MAFLLKQGLIETPKIRNELMVEFVHLIFKVEFCLQHVAA